MTRRTFEHLYAVPMDIQKRKARIEKLETIQAEGPATLSDTVKSSTDAGNATILCHAVIRGQDIGFNRTEQHIAALRRELDQLQRRYREDYAAACTLIEQCGDPRLRIALHCRCLDGMQWGEIAGQMAKAGFYMGEDNIRKLVDRWMVDNLG